jgi:formate/nitrite transporter FocA (FNT family)
MSLMKPRSDFENRRGSVGSFLTEFLIPVLLGNIIGGVALVAALAHAEFIFEGGGEPA